MVVSHSAQVRADGMKRLGERAFDSPQQAGGTSIIPALPSPPGPVNLTQPISVSSYTVAAGSYLRANLGHVFQSPDANYLGPLINYGTIWNEGWAVGLFNNIRDVANHGTMVLKTDQEVHVTAFSVTSFTNSGSVFVIAGAGKASFVEYAAGRCDNSGLIAVQSQSRHAMALHFLNGGDFSNQASGRILAEGNSAVALYMYGGAHPMASPEYARIVNHGRIEARATGDGQASIALLLEHSDDYVYVINSGVIKADIAVLTTYNTTTARPTYDHITNEAGGLIEGLLFLDRGEDRVINRGTITGDLFMEEGNDAVENSGTINGITDLGFGDDIYIGSSAPDFVAGDLGKDNLEGGGGNDQLMGGSDSDRLVGGAGNDGLFGERGDDLIITKDCDYASGGAGDDRIEASDFSFAVVDGDSGFDTLVLPALGRALSLTAMLDQGRLFEIEALVLGGGQSLSVRSSDVTRLTGGETELRVTISASDRLDLVGAWMGGNVVDVGGASYRRYTLDGVAVLVAGAGAVATGALATGGGLDLVAGIAAPMPGGKSRLGYTSSFLEVSNYELTQSLTVDAGETWASVDGNAVLRAFSPNAVLTNHGTLLSVREASSTTMNAAFAIGGSSNHLARIVNYGTVILENHQAPAFTYAPETSSWGIHVDFQTRVENHGTISVMGAAGRVTAIEAGQVHNNGLIIVESVAGQVIGIDLLSSGSVFSNSGVIRAHADRPNTNFPGMNPAFGFTDVTAAWLKDGNHINSGTIEATAGGGARATALWFDLHNASTLTNTGLISSGTAIRVRSEAVTGTLHVDNDGRIVGDVVLGGGNDVFDGRGGVQAGLVRGEGGADDLKGGAAADTLDGGAGSDRLAGGSGIDRLTGGGDGDVFVFSSWDDSNPAALRSDGVKFLPDMIRDFQKGVDKIDLSGIDANLSTVADDAFVFIGNAAFTGLSGQLRYEAAGNLVHVFADADGNGVPDLHIVVAGTTTIAASDFIL